MIAPHRLPAAAVTLYRTFGFRGLVLRLGHEAARRVGAFRAEPRHPPSSVLPAPHPFAVEPAALRASTNREVALARAEHVLSGEYQAFRWNWRPLPLTPEDWTVHPRTGASYHPGLPWWRVPHFDAGAGDIKELWEPARFAWAYDLVRGYLLTGRDAYADHFHRRLSEWLASSPPFQGPHWSCGQEAAIRAVALLYAEANLAGAPSSTPEAMERLAFVLAASGERIRDAMGYAISQRNNHGISEATALVALGARFAGGHPEAKGWLARGSRTLARLIREQFAPDGWYVQHSFNYLRLALDQVVIANRILRAAGRTLSADCVQRIRAAADLLASVLEPSTGVAPNHGANDGALVHPIHTANYRDFRPVLSAVCALWRHPIPSNVAVDPEVLAWLGVEEPPRCAPIGDGVRQGASGWVSARVGGFTLFLRAGRYRSRPGHLDPMHVDVSHGATEIVVDPGTFSYHAPHPWRNGLSGARVHNGPVLDGREPGLRGPRFLWYEWPRARIVSVRWNSSEARVVAEVPGSHRRTVRVDRRGVRIEDLVLRRGASEVELRWLLHPDADPEVLRISEASERLAAVEGDPAGWFSPHYGQRLASRYLHVRRTVSRGEAIFTEIVLEPGAAPRHETPTRANGMVALR